MQVILMKISIIFRIKFLEGICCHSCQMSFWNTEKQHCVHNKVLKF